MADISKINVNGQIYEIKDSVARSLAQNGSEGRHFSHIQKPSSVKISLLQMMHLIDFGNCNFSGNYDSPDEVRMVYLYLL